MNDQRRRQPAPSASCLPARPMPENASLSNRLSDCLTPSQSRQICLLDALKRLSAHHLPINTLVIYNYQLSITVSCFISSVALLHSPVISHYHAPTHTKRVENRKAFFRFSTTFLQGHVQDSLSRRVSLSGCLDRVAWIWHLNTSIRPSLYARSRRALPYPRSSESEVSL